METPDDAFAPDLEDLFRKSGDDLRRYFSRRHGPVADAEDLVQETFAQFARTAGARGPLRCARGYLFGIARHLSQRAWARSRRADLRPLDAESAHVATVAPDARIEAARETIAALPPLQREILDLRFSQDLSYAEIAEVLGIPVGTVRSRLHHAVAELRARLDPPTTPSP